MRIIYDRPWAGPKHMGRGTVYTREGGPWQVFLTAEMQVNWKDVRTEEGRGLPQRRWGLGLLLSDI